MQAKLLLTNLFAGALALAPMAAFADCVNIEPLIQREARLEWHVEQGQAHGYLTQSESHKFKNKLDDLKQALGWHKEHHCMTMMENSRLNEELTRVSVRIFRALHRGESRIVNEQIAHRN